MKSNEPLASIFTMVNRYLKELVNASLKFEITSKSQEICSSQNPRCRNKGSGASVYKAFDGGRCNDTRNMKEPCNGVQRLQGLNVYYYGNGVR